MGRTKKWNFVFIQTFITCTEAGFYTSNVLSLFSDFNSCCHITSYLILTYLKRTHLKHEAMQGML